MSEEWKIRLQIEQVELMYEKVTKKFMPYRPVGSAWHMRGAAAEGGIVCEPLLR